MSASLQPEARARVAVLPCWRCGLQCQRGTFQPAAPAREDSIPNRSLRPAAEQHDRHGFLRSGVNRSRRTGIYLFYFPAMLRWSRTLTNERGQSGWLWHILRMALRASFRRRANPGRWAAPMSGDLLRMVLRHLRITFEPRWWTKPSASHQ